VNIFAMYTQKSAPARLRHSGGEVIVGGLRYEMKGMSVEAERNDWPSYPTPEVISEGLKVVSFQYCMEV